MTKDERFAGYVKKAHVLQQMCELIISGKIES
jgi:hypothetical protein